MCAELSPLQFLSRLRAERVVMYRELKKGADATPWLAMSLIAWLVALATVGAKVGMASDGARAAEKPAAALKISQSTAAKPQEAAPSPATPGTYSSTGAKACLECHSGGNVTDILHTKHAVEADKNTPFGQHQCESCHGASPQHIADPSVPVTVAFKGPHAAPLATRNETCLACHQSSQRTHWEGSQHEARGVSCTDCHNLHSTQQKVLNKATQAEVCFVCHKEQRAQTRRISTHPLATTSLATTASMACSSCHNPHGSVGPKLLVKNSANETCYTCHAEKRGPFLWEHAPVQEDCTNCHTPHGSTNASLLKTRPPLLCQQCHSGDHASQINSGANLGGGTVTTVNRTQQPGAAAPRAQIAARACLNCHVLVHGSNHPAGSKFQR
jgi:DmsE family decaheme c-type cytochrome